jgi:hypothetical protein
LLAGDEARSLVDEEKAKEEDTTEDDLQGYRKPPLYGTFQMFESDILQVAKAMRD